MFNLRTVNLKLMVKLNCCRFKSGELRGNIDSLLSTSCTELMTAWSAANRNFKVRVDDEKVRSLTKGLNKQKYSSLIYEKSWV